MKKSVIVLINQIDRIMKTNISDFNVILNDLKMSSYKVRAIEGEIDQLVKSNPHFLKTIWKMNKVNNLVSKHYDKLADHDKKLPNQEMPGGFWDFRKVKSSFLV